MAKVILYLVFSIIGYAVHGQLLPFKTFGTREGMIDQEVTAVTQDERGLLWVGTPFGLNWFDGTYFYVPPVIAKTGQLYVKNFYKESDNTIWVLTYYNGLYKYKDGAFLNYLPDPRVISTQNNVFDMLRYNSTQYLVATDGMVFWFDGTSFTVFPKDHSVEKEQVNVLWKLDDGSILTGTDKGIYYYERSGNTFRKTTTYLAGHSIHQFTSDDTGLWIATNKGLYHYHSEKAFRSGDPAEIIMNGKFVGMAAKSRNGDHWISSDRVYKSNRNRIVSYSVLNGLPANPSRIFHDKQGITWFATSKGLSRLTNEYYQYNDLTKGPMNSMTISMNKDENSNLWLGSYNGLAKKTGDVYTIYMKMDGKDIGYVSWMQKTVSGKLLAGTSVGILYLNAKGVFKISDFVSSRAFADGAGMTWLGTIDGKIYSLYNDSVKQMQLSNPVVDYIDGLYKDRNGFLWVGYRGYGVIKYRITGEQLLQVKEFTARTGFNDLRIRSSGIDKNGNVIFGTRTNGIYIFSVNEDSHWHINSSAGLSANWVKSIAVDAESNIYLATNKGINILKEGNYDQPVIKKPDLSNTGNEISTNTLLLDNDTVWVATDQGLIQYFPGKDLPDTTHPGIFFTKVTVNSRTDSAFAPYQEAVRSLQLPYDSNIVAFEFAGIDLKGEGIRYSYYLEGQEKSWSEPTDRNFVSYHLQPGSYTFKVRAINRDGSISMDTASIRIVINAPFWKQGWFIVLCIVFISMIIYGVYKYRIRQLMKLERLRSRISADLHDDIGSTLSSISILSEVAIHEDNESESRKMVNEIKESSISLLEKMDDIIWSVNPLNDSMEDLLLRIKRFAGKLFEAKNIEYTIDIDESIEQANLSMEYRQHIFLIIKEAVNNLVKYSGSADASIYIKNENGILNVIITDHGKGFDVSERTTGNGIYNMRSRSKAIGADLIIESGPGKGTRVILRSKIK